MNKFANNMIFHIHIYSAACIYIQGKPVLSLRSWLTFIGCNTHPNQNDKSYTFNLCNTAK